MIRKILKKLRFKIHFFFVSKKYTKKQIHYISGNETLPPPLSPEEEETLIAQLPQKDKSVRQKLIEHNLRLVVYIARKFDNTGFCIEDLISIGTIGLIKAINTFNPEKNIKLATYASRCIENEILMFLRKNLSLKTEISIDEPLNVDWDGNELLLSDVIGTDDDVVHRRLEDRTEKEMLLCAMKKLSAREQNIMNMRFGLFGTKERTQKEVADILGISQSYISRLEKRIIAKLKKEVSKLL